MQQLPQDPFQINPYKTEIKQRTDPQPAENAFIMVDKSMHLKGGNGSLRQSTNRNAHLVRSNPEEYRDSEGWTETEQGKSQGRALQIMPQLLKSSKEENFKDGGRHDYRSVEW